MTTLLNRQVLASLSISVLLAIGGNAMADDSAAPNAGASPAPQHHRHHKGMRKVFEACAKANDVTLPAKGSGETLSTGDRTALHACVQEFRQDFMSCVKQAGLSRPDPGNPPSAADKAAFKQCRTTALGEISSK